VTSAAITAQASGTVMIFMGLSSQVCEAMPTG
jgi:hypothetical protein